MNTIVKQLFLIDRREFVPCLEKNVQLVLLNPLQIFIAVLSVIEKVTVYFSFSIFFFKSFFSQDPISTCPSTTPLNPKNEEETSIADVATSLNPKNEEKTSIDDVNTS